MPLQTIGFIYAIGAAIVWGLVYTIDQKILANTSPVILLFMSSIFGAILLLPFVLTQSGEFASLATLGRQRILLIVISVALATFASYLILASIERLGASTASIFEIVYPFFVFLFSFFIFGARLNGYVFAGSLLIFLGSAIIMRFG